MTHDLGRHVYGAAAILAGVLILTWNELHDFVALQALGPTSDHELVVYAAGVAALAGGVALQWRRSAARGAAILGVLYLVYAALFILPILKAPAVFDPWGNFFEQFAILIGAPLVYIRVMPNTSPSAVNAGKIMRILFGICVATFALYQAVHLQYTAQLVPKWVPPGQMFWTIFTTVAFALAALAILTGRQALLASQLLTAMLVVFQLLIWVPAVFVSPRSHANWIENFTNLAIAATAWVLADYLRAEQPVTRHLEAEKQKTAHAEST